MEIIRIAAQTKNKKVRVAVYCRVSTKSEEQEDSLTIQCEAYLSLIRIRSAWESCLESNTPAGLRFLSVKTTAAATTGPAMQPRPASSTPATKENPSTHFTVSQARSRSRTDRNSSGEELLTAVFFFVMSAGRRIRR